MDFARAHSCPNLPVLKRHHPVFQNLWDASAVTTRLSARPMHLCKVSPGNASSLVFPHVRGIRVCRPIAVDACELGSKLRSQGVCGHEPSQAGA